MSVQPEVSGIANPRNEIHDARIQGTADTSARLTAQAMSARAEGATLVLVDVSSVTSVRPSGVADLLHAVRHMRTTGGDLRLYGYSSAFDDALRALDLARVLRVHPDRDSALRGHTRAIGELTEPVLRPKRFGRRVRSVRSS